MHYTYLIIGGGIAGVTATETIRAHDPDGTIALVSHEEYLLYSRVLLPNYIKKKIKREQVFLRTTEDFGKNRITIILGKTVTLLNTQKNTLHLGHGEVYTYDKLLIASGGTPQPLGAMDEKQEGVFHLQTIDDADHILHFLPRAEKMLVVGSSFISLEFLEIGHVHHIPTTLIARDKYFFGKALDEMGGTVLQKNFEKMGIETIFEEQAVAIEGGAIAAGLRTNTGKVYQGNMIALGIGLKRNSTFTLGSGLELGATAGVKTNEFLQTNIENIFAAGDIAEYFDVRTTRYHTHGNWANAFLQGRIAGQNMAGQTKVAFQSIPFYSITNLGMHITFLGEVKDGAAVTTIARTDERFFRYERFFMKDGFLVGAVLINMFQDKQPLVLLIEKKIPMEQWQDNLQDIAFDIKTIPH